MSLQKAIKIATDAHYGQVDQTGEPYILHPMRVMLRFPPGDDLHRMVAILHDVLEDTNVTFTNLVDIGIPMSAVDAVDALTRGKNEPYDSYLTRVENNEVATQVKIYDMQDNLDASRLAHLPEDVQQRLIKKYTRGLMRLKGCIK